MVRGKTSGIAWDKSNKQWIVRPIRSGGLYLGSSSHFEVAVQLLKEYYKATGTIRPVMIEGKMCSDYLVKEWYKQ